MEMSRRTTRPIGRPRAEPQESRKDHAGPASVGQDAHQVAHTALQQISGVLLEHAAAPYQFDASQRMSYYVRVRTEVGDRTLWGADLERAIAESRSTPHKGDLVILRRFASRPVTVRVPERNAAGELIGDKKITTQRANWSVETPEYLDSLSRKAAALRPGGPPAEAVLKEYPDLAGAVVGLRLAERFAQRFTANEGDRLRVVDAIREGLANAVERGERIRMPERRARASPEHHRSRSMPKFDDPPSANPSHVR
jgi:putative DNA primase/helicase